MLQLKRMTHPYETLIDDSNGQVLMYGDFYYEDDKTGKRINATAYQALKKEKKESDWDYSRRDFYESDKDYREALREKEMELMQQTILDQPIYGREWENVGKKDGDE